MILALSRIALGIFFLIVGGEQIISGRENFLYVIQGYDLFPDMAEQVLAWVVPWVEYFLGAFLIVGLYLRLSLPFLLSLLAGFIIVVGQAIVRGLPIDECGCFGRLFSFPLEGVLLFDSLLVLLALIMLIRLNYTSRLSLDKYFLKNK